MENRLTEVFISAFPCQYSIITLEQGIEVGLAEDEWDGIHEDHRSITYNHEWGNVFVSILLGMICLESTEKIQNRWGSVVTGHIRSCWKRGRTLIWISDHQFVYVKWTCAVFTFLHNASCCIEIYYVVFTSLVEYVNAFLWPKHHTLWMKNHFLDNLIRLIFFFFYHHLETESFILMFPVLHSLSAGNGFQNTWWWCLISTARLKHRFLQVFHFRKIECPW